MLHTVTYVQRDCYLSLVPMQACNVPVQVWQLTFTRLQSNPSPRYYRAFLGFLSMFVCRKDANTVQASIDQVQQGLFSMIVQQVRMSGSVTQAAIDKCLQEQAFNLAKQKRCDVCAGI